MSGLRFGWRDDTQIAIDRFVVAQGERVFISGPSGCGKSTLLSLIGGVARPKEGVIEILGTDIAGLRTARRDRFRADHLGIIFQLFNLVPYLSVLENVLLPCRFSVARRERLAERGTTAEQECGRLLAALELDPVALADRPVVELSIGQQQRVAVARALLGAPELIVADEPTSALDEGMSARFVELLLAQSAACGSAVLFVSHDLRIAAQFDRHVLFDQMNSAANGSSTTAP